MKRIGLVSSFLSAIIAIAIVRVGIQHNSMGEFCFNADLDTCNLDWLYVLQLWAFWFVPVALVLFAIGLAIRWLFRANKR